MKRQPIKRLLSAIRFIWEAHIVNWFWLSHSEHGYNRRAARGRFLRRFLEPLKEDFAQVEPDSEAPEPEPERVFTIWLQGEQHAPTVVKSCIASMRRNTGKEVVVLDMHSVFDWIKLPDAITNLWESGKIGAAHFSDICRVALLYQHGGYWMDATNLSTGPFPKWMEQAEVFLYETRSEPLTFHIGFQNCFIRAKKGNFMMKAWLHAMITYWKEIGYPKAYMIHQVILDFIVNSDPRIKEIYDRMPHVEQHPTHRLWWEFGNKPFNESAWETIATEAPFQKTRHKDNPFLIPGSFRDITIRRELPNIGSEGKGQTNPY